MPIRANESLLRIITKDWYIPKKPIPFGSVAFKPNANDGDGISLYRARFVSATSLNAGHRKPGTFFVARLQLNDILALNLTVEANLGDFPGHVVIPELNAKALTANKKR